MKFILTVMALFVQRNYLNLSYGYCLYSEYQIQKDDSYCGSYFLYIIYLTKVIGSDFKSAVLILYYQRFS